MKTFLADLWSWFTHFVIAFWITVTASLFVEVGEAAAGAIGFYGGREWSQHEDHGTPPKRVLDRVMDFVAAVIGAALALRLLS